MPRVDKKKRFDMIVDLLKTSPRTCTELAKELGCSEKTVKRDRKEMEQSGFRFAFIKRKLCLLETGIIKNQDEKKYSPVRMSRLMYILILIQKDREIRFERLKAKYIAMRREEEYGDDCLTDEAERKAKDRYINSLQRDLDLLLENGYVVKNDNVYSLGERILPPVMLSDEEIAGLYGLIKEFGRLSPYEVPLSSVLGKLLAIQTYRERVLESPMLGKRLERIMVHGRQFNNDPAFIRFREDLEYAIQHKVSVNIEYGKTKESTEVRIISPLGFCYNRFNDLWYVYVLPLSDIGYPQILRLDYFWRVELTDTFFTVPEGFDIRKCVEPSWGISLDKTVQVKVRFKDVYNVVDKVKKQLTCRPGSSLTWGAGALIMEDTISGVSEFRSWLRQFGYAAEVLEPEELRGDFLNTAVKLLHVYGQELPRETGWEGAGA